MPVSAPSARASRSHRTAASALQVFRWGRAGSGASPFVEHHDGRLSPGGGRPEIDDRLGLRFAASEAAVAADRRPLQPRRAERGRVGSQVPEDGGQHPGRLERVVERIGRRAGRARRPRRIAGRAAAPRRGGGRSRSRVSRRRRRRSADRGSRRRRPPRPDSSSGWSTSCSDCEARHHASEALSFVDPIAEKGHAHEHPREPSSHRTPPSVPRVTRVPAASRCSRPSSSRRFSCPRAHPGRRWWRASRGGASPPPARKRPAGRSASPRRRAGGVRGGQRPLRGAHRGPRLHAPPPACAST